MKKIILLTLFCVGCASSHKMKELDVSIQEKGKVSQNEVVGLNSSGEAVVQQRQKASEELRGIVWWNNNLEQELSSSRHELRRCRVESADPRLGGSGEVTDVPEVDGLKPTSEVREQIGLINEDIMVVKEEYLKDRIKLEKDYNLTLEKMVKMVKGYNQKCEEKLGMQRVKAGLPSQRYQGKFKISSDGKLEQVVERHEKNLDDAFEIQEEKRSKRLPAVESQVPQIETVSEEE